MEAHNIFLHFADHHEAISVLAAAGFQCALSEDGVLRLPCQGRVGKQQFVLDLLFATGSIHHPTGETAAFEGEVIPLTVPVCGLWLALVWEGAIPRAILPHIAHPGLSVAQASALAD
ncbi:MAG TPA: hypothetical protein VHG11_06170 [Pseudorhizobium sp.]|nr:hypothetical protein [Pseudorhizobium sp.]